MQTDRSAVTETTVFATGRSVRGLAVLALIAATGIGMLATRFAAGLNVGFLLGGNRHSAGGLASFVGTLNSMAGPLTAVGASAAVLGAIGGGIMLVVGHPQGARLLGRVALGAIVITAASGIVS